MSMEEEIERHQRAIHRINELSQKAHLEGSIEHADAIDNECRLHGLKLQLEVRKCTPTPPDLEPTR
jgi:hypothetical protein